MDGSNRLPQLAVLLPDLGVPPVADELVDPLSHFMPIAQWLRIDGDMSATGSPRWHVERHA
jgi:hypothetical protein